MPFSWDAIRTDWLLNLPIHYEQDEIVDAFNTIEAQFGSEWFNRLRGQRGVLISIRLVELGNILKAIKKVPGAGNLIRDLQNWKEFGLARLMAYFF